MKQYLFKVLRYNYCNLCIYTALLGSAKVPFEFFHSMLRIKKTILQDFKLNNT